MSDERERFMQVARVRFRDFEIEDVSLEEIAEEAGMEMERVHLYFPEKLALVFTLLQEEFSRVIDAAMKGLPETSIEAQLKHLLRQRYEFFEAYRGSAAEVFREVVFSNKGWCADYDTMLWRFSVGIVALFQAAKRRGELRTDVDEALAARALISFYVSGMLMIMRGEVKDAQAACDFTFPLVEHLIKSMN